MDFETIVLTTPEATLHRQYRELYISPEDYKRVYEKKGEYCEVVVSGGGMYSNWYFYHTMDDNFVYIIQNMISDEFSWQSGCPQAPEIQDDEFSVQDLSFMEEKNFEQSYYMKRLDSPLKFDSPPKLVRTYCDEIVEENKYVMEYMGSRPKEFCPYCTDENDKSCPYYIE